MDAIAANPLHTASPADLVSAHLAGHPRAFAALVAAYRPRLIRFIHRIIRDWDRAEDLVQETFLRVHRHLHRFDPTRQFSTWVYTIAGNLARNELRNRARTPVVSLWSADPTGQETWTREVEDHSHRPDRLLQLRNLEEVVHQGMARLSEHHREVFLLREIEGQAYEEIASRTGCNLGTVKSRLSRARQQFAAVVEPMLR